MSGDNRIFNVNGRLDRGGDKLLLETLKLAFAIRSENTRATGYRIDHKLGLVLYWDSDSEKKPEVSRFPTPLTAEQVFPIMLAYLQSKPECECVGKDSDYDHDGHNGPGWRVYCEDWGHVGGEWQAFLAIKPAYIWYGK